ncbi:MAG: recombination-associated protein RdgC [Thermodesulfobacteriota bacterium]
MGILSGGIRLRRYQVLGELPQGFRAAYEEAIQAHAFRDFAPDDEREQVLGWAPVDDWFDPSLPLDRWLVEHTVNLTFRVDTKRIPARFLKQECRKLEAQWRLKSGREDLSRAERDEIEAIVRRQLLERAIPSCQGTDLSWDLNRGEVLFWSTGERLNESFRALFEKTFAVKLRPLFPYLLALRALGQEKAEIVDRVVPSVFRPEGGA